MYAQTEPFSRTIRLRVWKRWCNGICLDSTRSQRVWRNLTIRSWANSIAAAGNIPTDRLLSTLPNRYTQLYKWIGQLLLLVNLINLQVSHHPPISALYVTNRKDGFTLSATILAKSKFYGNSLSALLDGSARLTLLPRGEDYIITMPYAHCKGILLGTLTMEMGGEVYLKCEKTGYRADLEFKLKVHFITWISNWIKFL